MVVPLRGLVADSLPLENPQNGKHSLIKLNCNCAPIVIRDRHPQRRRHGALLVSRIQDQTRHFPPSFLAFMLARGSLLQIHPPLTETARALLAHFPRGDLAYHWLCAYIEHHDFRKASGFHAFSIKSRDTMRDAHVLVRNNDGYLDAVYNFDWALPVLFWKRGWIAAYLDESGLTLQVWGFSRRAQALRDLVQEARHFYQSRTEPPAFVTDESASALVTAVFDAVDMSATWILAYLQSQPSIMLETSRFCVSTRQYDSGWATAGTKVTGSSASREQVYSLPPRNGSTHRFRWRDYWVQASIAPLKITIIIHTTDKSIMFSFIEAARAKYIEAATACVNVYLAQASLTTDSMHWGRVVTKRQRPYATLVLPNGIKENLLADVKEFLDSEDWYRHANVPHRRGYLLYGQPGTGKSTTVHALAGELGMQIFFLSLATPGIDDNTLGDLFDGVTPHSILLIEDIDCAFPSRQTHVEVSVQGPGRPTEMPSPRSAVTLAGLLNAMDSVTSQEGRLLICTTNHIERLDPALIRPGRIDVRIRYSLATAEQLKDAFHRFYPCDTGSPAGAFKSTSGACTQLARSEVEQLALEFAAAIPQDAYSVAQIQGYLLGYKKDPFGAVAHVAAWVESQRFGEEVRRFGKQGFLTPEDSESD
uniref:Mitochondrial chaperone BCS1 n=1 Tax=Mycena chlorophos TaxID=658473 RepID=A0ABQ0M109_MYCCL|nr:mitochondrial chaperone BCS1 [Mycena chlorophos]